MVPHLGRIWVTTNEIKEPFLLACSELFNAKLIRRGESVIDCIIMKTDYIISNELNEIFLYKNASRDTIQVIIKPSGLENFDKGWIDAEFKGMWHRKNTLRGWFNNGGVIISDKVRLNF